MTTPGGRPTARASPTIRPAGPHDANAIREIYNEAVETTTATFDTQARSLPEQRQWLAHHGARHPVLVAEVHGAVVGWVALSPWSDRRAYDGTGEVSVYVGSRSRGLGIGRALLESIVLKARGLDFHTILARVAEGNPISRQLHVAAGFTPVGVMHEVGRKFGRFLDVELLELHLGPRAGQHDRA